MHKVIDLTLKVSPEDSLKCFAAISWLAGGIGQSGQKIPTPNKSGSVAVPLASGKSSQSIKVTFTLEGSGVSSSACKCEAGS